jgi:hypothetical protein
MNLALALALAASLPLAAAPPAAPPPPAAPAAPAASEEPVPGAPVRGSAEDRALWFSMRDDWHQLIVQRAAAHKVYYRLRPETENARLMAIGKEHPELLPQVEALQRRLYAARKETYDLMAARWPVDPRRACRSELDDLAVAIDAEASPGGADALRSARVAARVCTEKLRSVLVPLTESNARLGAVVKDVDAFLAAAPVPTAASPVAAAQDDDEDDHPHDEDGHRGEHGEGKDARGASPKPEKEK